MALNRRIVLDDAEINAIEPEQTGVGSWGCVQQVDPVKQMVRVGNNVYTFEQFEALRKVFAEAANRGPQIKSPSDVGSALPNYADYSKSVTLDWSTIHTPNVIANVASQPFVLPKGFQERLLDAIKHRDPAGMNFQDIDQLFDGFDDF